MINVIFKLRQQSANEISNEHHLGLQGAENRKKDRFQRPWEDLRWEIGM
jgi:hypothetical protein